MTVPPEQIETAKLLARLSGGPPLETHISLVFRGPDTVWKLKKAVALPFLDYSTIESRGVFTRREFELNAPFAPGLYRDVAAVIRETDGALSLEPSPQPGQEILDWVLRMARVPDGDFLDVMAASGQLATGLLDATADAVAAYHTALPPRFEIEAADTTRLLILSNTKSALEAGLPKERTIAWMDRALPAVDRIVGWLSDRRGAGFVRRAHGDLHLGNMCLWDGKPVPFDALEFDEHLAVIDIGYDLAFLLMDLERRVGRKAANRFMNRYIARTGDAGLVHGLPVFLSLRAMIRAHVELRRGREGLCRAYYDDAMRALDPSPPLLVAVGGLMASGKSTLARALAPDLGKTPGAVILRSDEIRKRQHGEAPETKLGPDAYTPAADAAVRAALMAGCAGVVESGYAAIGDATFLDPAWRSEIAALAARAGVGFAGFWLTAPVEELERRVIARSENPASGDASDATLAVLRRAASQAPSPDQLDHGWTIIDAVDATAAVRCAREKIRAIAASC